MKSTNFPLHCDALVDQGRKVGGDPVGYRCQQPAEFEVQNGPLLCVACQFMLAQEPKRLKFRQPWGSEYQLKKIRKIMAGLGKRVLS